MNTSVLKLMTGCICDTGMQHTITAVQKSLCSIKQDFEVS